VLKLLAILVCVLTLQAPQNPPANAPSTQPASRPVATRSTDDAVLRRPVQADILTKLLGREDRAAPIRPQDPGAALQLPEAELTEGSESLLADGSFLVERPGRLVVEDGVPRFRFIAEEGVVELRDMELVPNQLLELMEREARRGAVEFIVSGEVTRYRGANYLILRKLLRRIENGNLAP
jgi:hypothetical protein